MRASRGGGGLNVRIRLTSARQRSLAPAPPIRSIPTAAVDRGSRARDRRSEAGGWCLPQGRARMGKPASGVTCDGPGPAVELHRVVERRGHHVQDTARLRVQEPHRGGQREQAAAGGESTDPTGGSTEDDGRGGERQPGTPLAAAAQQRLFLLLGAPQEHGCGGGGGGEPGRGDGTVKAPKRRKTSSCCERRALHHSAASRGRRSNLLGWRHVGARGAEDRRAPPPAPAQGLGSRDAAFWGRWEPGPRRRVLYRTPRSYPFSWLRGSVTPGSLLAALPRESSGASSTPPSSASGPEEEYTAFPPVTSHPPRMHLKKLDREEWAFCGQG